MSSHLRPPQLGISSSRGGRATPAAVAPAEEAAPDGTPEIPSFQAPAPPLAAFQCSFQYSSASA
eukprot:8314347-Lingulodinium_polyedra.AAC.1